MASFCAPSINVYSPDPKSVAGVNIKDTSFVCIGSSEKDCSLKDPVELPKVPVGVNVPEHYGLKSHESGAPHTKITNHQVDYCHI
jgi:hypothetical protein